jgi:hypothetical protein
VEGEFYRGEAGAPRKIRSDAVRNEEGGFPETVDLRA